MNRKPGPDALYEKAPMNIGASKRVDLKETKTEREKRYALSVSCP
jgi:hypothetical protein